MKLWSIRRVSELEGLARDGAFRTSPDKADKDLRIAYQWMADQLRAKTGQPPKDIDYPIWVWQFCQGTKRPAPDLRSRCLLPKGSHGIRVEFEIPESSVLLSDFDGWHSVLNNHHYSLNDNEYNEIEQLIALKGSNHPEIEHLKRQSWQRIFDLSLISDVSNTAIQGVVWEIPESSIKKIDHFVAR